MKGAPKSEGVADSRSVRPKLLKSIVQSAFLDLSPLVVLSCIAIGCLSVFMPLAIMQVYDRLIPNRAVESTIILIGLILAVTIIEAGLRIARNHIVSWGATKLAWRTHCESLSRFMSAPAHVVEAESASRNLDRIQALMAFAEWHGSPSRLVLVDLPFFMLYVGLMIIVGQWLAAVPLVLFVLIAVVVHLRSKALRHVNETRDMEDMKVKDFLVESLSGLATIKANAMESQMLRRYERLQETVAKQSYASIRLSEEAQALVGALSNFAQMATTTVGAVFVIHGDISVGALACCVMLAGRAIQPLLRCVSAWNELQSVVVGAEKAAPILNLPEAQVIPPGTHTSEPFGAELRHVTFRHSETGPKILDEATFTVAPGKITAISGPDGSGKSTIADLMSGYLQNYEGEIRVGSFDPRTDRALLKRHVAIVRPGASIMRGSILDNITMFRKGDEVELAMQAARLIGLDRDIHRLPLGYQTIVSEGVSAELPAGFIQRIAIARAIARRPALMILDEANSALDMRGDQALIEGLSRIKSHMTIVAITNRPSLAAIADQRFYLETGSIRAHIAGPQAQTAGVTNQRVS